MEIFPYPSYKCATLNTNPQPLFMCAGKSGGLSDIFSQYTLRGLCSYAEVWRLPQGEFQRWGQLQQHICIS